MAREYVSLRTLRFLLFEVFGVQETLPRIERFADYDREAMDMALEAAKQLADQHFFPIYREMDTHKVRLENGRVHTLPALGDAIRAMAEGGWISAPADFEEGGQQMPWTLLQACLFVLYSANGNAASYALLTQSAAGLIRRYGSPELKETYVPHMFAGRWQGTMALTEPQAGSSLMDLSTTAVPDEAGFYRLRGQKIFISGGDHDHAENVVHLLLARIEGAPPGTKGVSLFVVPKLRPEGGRLVPNDVTTAGLFEKMGQRGYVAAHLMLGEGGDCRGWLVGEPHKGLAYMFQMMNEARIGTGNMAAGMASAAYHASLQYARERAQGRHPSRKDPTLPPVPIIEHADVRRMLLFQKAVVEGSIALLVQCSLYFDRSHYGSPEEREDAHLLLELLTPVCKSWPAEMGNLSVSMGMQVLGGAGYTTDFPLEQYYRDIRVNAIYEGTTGIHGLDLLGRKVFLHDGRALKLFAGEVSETIARAAEHERLQPHAEALGEALQTLQTVTQHLARLAQTRPPEYFLADAVLYLECFGHIAVAWQWLRQGIAAVQGLANEDSPQTDAFYRGKLLTLDYFFEYELPKIQSLRSRLLSSNHLTVELEEAWLEEV